MNRRRSLLSSQVAQRRLGARQLELVDDGARHQSRPPLLQHELVPARATPAVPESDEGRGLDVRVALLLAACATRRQVDVTTSATRHEVERSLAEVVMRGDQTALVVVLLVQEVRGQQQPRLARVPTKVADALQVIGAVRLQRAGGTTSVVVQMQKQPSAHKPAEEDEHGRAQLDSSVECRSRRAPHPAARPRPTGHSSLRCDCTRW